MHRFLSKHPQKALKIACRWLKTPSGVTHKALKAHSLLPSQHTHQSDVMSPWLSVSGEMGAAPSEHFGCCLLYVHTWCRLRWCLERHTVTLRGDVRDTVNLASVFAYLWKRIRTHHITCSTQSEAVQVSLCSIHFRNWRYWTLNLIGRHRMRPEVPMYTIQINVYIF